MYDVNDICAMENRRQEVAVKAGVALRVAKAEPSVFKDMQVKWFEEFYPEVATEFGELLKTTEFPGYNWGATLHDVAKLSAEQQATPEEIEAELARLAEESEANELQVTRTGTGQPKVDDSGNVVPPVQGGEPAADSTKKVPVAKAPPVATQTPVVVVKDDKKKD
jgi:hypothetical protein